MAIAEADVRAVLDRYGLSGVETESLGSAGGFSGARLWRVHTHLGDLCLKCWPALAPERHREIAELMRAARDAGHSFVPRISPTLDGSRHVCGPGRLWDLVEWMPGTADFHANPSRERLRAACTALARLHRAWERFAAERRQCPGVIRRLVIVRNTIDATVGPPSGHLAAALGGGPLDRLMHRARAIVEWRLPRIAGELAPWEFVPMAVQPCLCDVWHDHVLFTGDEVTGLIDYGSAKLDNVAVDLARLLGSLVGDDVPMYEFGLDSYAAVRPLTEKERTLVRAIDRTSVILGLANWCRRLVYSSDQFDDRTTVGRRIEELVCRAVRWDEQTI